MVVILGIIGDFLHKPYNSVEDPLDLWFHSLSSGSVVPAFSVGYSVGMAKSQATLAILLAVQQLESAGSFTADEFSTVGAEIAALLSIKAMTDPGKTIEEQVEKSIAKKFRVSDRPRPTVVQLHTAFAKVVAHKHATGDSRPDGQLLGIVIKEFNGKQTSKNRVQSDEREAILTLHNQTPEFRRVLVEHWQAFPVACSAVPVSLLAKPWHNNSYEPPVKKQVSPRTYEALLGSPEKREMWLKRVVGKYLKNLKDARASGKPVNLRSQGAVFRKEPDEELVRHMSCLFTAWLPEFRRNLSPAGLEELIARFYRGALDRELAEKFKSADESLQTNDWRFLTTMSEFKGQVSSVGDVSMADAAQEKLAADFKYDMLALKKEEKMWATYLTQTRMFHAESHNSKVEEQEAVQILWMATAKDYIKVRYPVRGLKAVQDAPSLTTTMVENFAEHLGVQKANTYKIYVANLTFVGAAYEKKIPEVISIIRDKILNDPERSCAVVVAPNTGSYRQTYDEDAAEKSRREVLDLLRDDANEFMVADCTLFFDPASMWSKSRRLKHEVFMCISNRRTEKGELRSKFQSSTFFIRQSVSQFVTCLQRHEMVDPTVRINAGDQGSLSKMRERAQWVTGSSVYGTLINDVWKGMSVSCEDVACIIDLLGYDHHLATTVMTRAGIVDASTPREMCGTLVSEGKQVEDFLENRIVAKLRNKCEEKQYIVAGAPDLSAVVVTGARVFVKPTYNEEDYKLTKPLADDTLPLRSTTVDKWMGSGVPVSMVDQFKAELLKHNTTFNKEGRPWSPAATEQVKRPAVEPAVGQDAVPMPPTEGGPQTVEEITKKHPQLCEKTVGGVKFMSSLDGPLYAIVTEDLVFSRHTPLALLAGDYVVGTKYEQAIADGMDIFEWKMTSDTFEASFTCEPEMGFSPELAPLHKFLHFLESKNKVRVNIECHNYKRDTTTSTTSSPDRHATYTVTNQEKCGFKPKPRGLVNQKVPFCSGVGNGALKDAPLLRMCMRLKYTDDQKSIQPQRPGVYFKKDMRMKKGIYQLL